MAHQDSPSTEVVGSSQRVREIVKRCRLTVVDGPDAGRVWTAGGPRVIVGTHESADLQLSDRSVSRFHCEIFMRDGRTKVRDLNSSNGTRVDTVRVDTAELVAGCVLILGRTRLSFDYGASDIEVPASERDRFGLLIGRSTAMRTAFAILERAAETDATVLLEGETGTGKEAAAESIHLESSRRDGPFVVVDCSAVPPDLLESELFGHMRGAFTGAIRDRRGAFEAGHGGTVFLDEIGELSPELQPRLLRVLERRHVKRVGADSYVDVDVRIIAATNRNLRAEVNARRFRSDLYYRLAVIEVRLPPLRERLHDVEPLVRHLVDRVGASARPEAAELIGEQFLAHLSRHDWPGNVRELRNYLERCLALRAQMPLAADAPVASGIDGGSHGELVVDSTRPLKDERERWTRTLERRYVVELLERHGDNVSAAARAAEVDRVYFHRLLRRHGLR